MQTSIDKGALSPSGASAGASAPGSASTGTQRTVYSVLGAISFSHLLNDMIQSLILAIYPMFKSEFALSFGQIGLITLVYQVTASLLQPLVGLYTDKHPKPYSLPVGMGFTLSGLLLMSIAGNFGTLLIAAALVGCGSSVFHPESSRVARMASGGKHGLAQSLFQVGGNAGSSLGPLLAALIVIPHGQKSIAWFSAAALVAMFVLANIGRWYKRHPATKKGRAQVAHATLPRNKVIMAMSVLVLLVFSKYFYLASITSYFTFYLISKFGLSVQAAQIHLFVFLAAVAAGTIIGGPVGDKVGRKVGDLGVDSRRRAVHAADALCEPVLDGRVVGDHRARAGFGVLGDSRLCAGTDSGQGRDGRGPVLRLRVRDGRRRRGGARASRRCDQHRLRVQGLCVPAVARRADGVAAEDA